MKRFLFVLGLCLVGAGLAFVAPAEAVVTPCGEFTFFAKNRIAFEQGATTVNGNVLVTSATGVVVVGAHNTINGTVTAHKITLGTGSVVATCVADIVTGPGTCTTTTGTFAAFAAANPTCVDYPLTDPVVVDTCVDTAPKLNVTTNPTNLAPGCYGALNVADGVTLNLVAGTYNFKTIFLGSGSDVIGVDDSTIVNVKGLFTTENAVVLTNLQINSAQSVGEAHIGHGSIVTNVTFNIPRGTLHIHTGSELKECSELVGQKLEVQPVRTECEPAPNVCICPPGSEVPGGSPVCVPIGGLGN